MTDYEVYVGRVIDPTQGWKQLGDHWHRNVERVQDLAIGIEALMRVTRWIDDGTLQGRQVDWGAWIADVTKQQLLELYAAGPEPEPVDVGPWRPFMEGKSDEEIRRTMGWDRRSEIRELPHDDYVLVAVEGV